MKRVYFIFFVVSFLTISSSCLFIPSCKKDDDNPIIKGTPRYNEAECIPCRTYSDMFRMTNPCYLRTHFSRQTPGTSVFLNSNCMFIVDYE